MGYLVVDFAVGILEREVLEFRFDGVEAQPVSQRCVEVRRLAGHIVAIFFVGVVVDHLHHAQPVGNHDDNHPYVFGKGEQQLAEVLALDSRLFGIEAVRLDEPPNELGNVVAELFPYGFDRQKLAHYQVEKQSRDEHAALHTHPVAQDECRVEVADDRIDALLVALVMSRLYCFGNEFTHAIEVDYRHRWLTVAQKLPINRQDILPFLGSEIAFFGHKV